MKFQDKVEQLLTRVGLKHTTVDFDNFIKRDNNYYYHVKIYKPDLYNKYDRVSVVEVDNKIDRFNKLLKREIQYAQVSCSELTRIKSDESYVSLTLKAVFNKEPVTVEG